MKYKQGQFIVTNTTNTIGWGYITKATDNHFYPMWLVIDRNVVQNHHYIQGGSYDIVVCSEHSLTHPNI